MAHILSIETSTTVCSVALHANGELLALREDHRINSHAANITIFIAEVTKEAGIALQQLDAVAVGKGPGSYTGLRIGVSAAKGLCYGLDIPLIGINTLESMLYNDMLKQYAEKSALLCPMLDARRMEVYCALFDAEKNWLQSTHALIVDESSFNKELEQHTILFFGDGAAKCKNVITHPNAVFIEELYPSARYTGILAHQRFSNNQFENVAYFEPFYLKEFVGTIPKKHL